MIIRQKLIVPHINKKRIVPRTEEKRRKVYIVYNRIYEVLADDGQYLIFIIMTDMGLEILKDSLMMIVDDDDKSKKEIPKDSLLFFTISSLLRFPLVYERILRAYLNNDVDDFTSTPYHKQDTVSFCSLVSTTHHKRPRRSQTHPLMHPLCLALVLVCLLLSGTLRIAQIHFGL